MPEHQAPPGGTPGGSCLNQPVKEIIKRIKEKGPVTFAEFMEVALYWPEGGYYTSPDSKVWGRGGDYITSLDVSPAFAGTMARGVLKMWEALGSPTDFTIVEAGAGRGLLTRGMIEAIRNTSSSFYAALRAVLVEKNPALRERGEVAGDKISWVERLDDIERPFTGCIISNELIDSFPFYIVEMRGGLREVYVTYEDSTFIEVFGVPSTPELEVYLKKAGVTLEQGQRAEVNLEGPRWIKQAAGLLEAGFILTIDYGYPAKELYSPERGPTLHCHFRHTLNADPYANIGKQDITAHVDFTSLAMAGSEAGCEVAGFTTQKDFLLSLGILEGLEETGGWSASDYEKIARNRLIGRLIAPGGMGDIFKVLVQHKCVEGAKKAFSFRDLSERL